MFPKAIVILFAVVVAEKAITNREIGKRQFSDEEKEILDKKEGYYNQCCICCDDVHCKTFDGLPIRLKGVCPANLMANLMNYIAEVEIGTVPMYSVSTGNKIGNLNITYNGVSYIIDKDCNVWINGNMLPRGIPYITLDVYIWWEGNKVYLLIRPLRVLIMRNCDERCVTVCVPDDMKNKTEGICGNYNDNPADDMLGYKKNLLGYWQYSRYWFQLAYCLPQGLYP